MLRSCKRVLWIFLWLAIGSALWALNVEATYEHNTRRGIPTDFHLQNHHRVPQWRA
jgi:hypothetical protein